MAPPPRHVPALVDDLIEEILIRCPPDDAAVLVRATAVCKDWLRVVSGPGFRRWFCERHRTAPMLGFLYYGGTPFRFEPTTSFRPHYASVDIGVQSALDARHGRVLLSRLSSISMREDLVVWGLAPIEVVGSNRIPHFRNDKVGGYGSGFHESTTK